MRYEKQIFFDQLCKVFNIRCVSQIPKQSHWPHLQASQEQYAVGRRQLKTCLGLGKLAGCDQISCLIKMSA